MFERIGTFAARHAKAVLAVTLVVLAGAAVLGFTAFGKLKSEGFTDPNAESSQAQQLINQHFGGQSDLLFLITPKTGGVDEPAAREAGARLTQRLAGEPELAKVTSYFTTNAPPMRAADGRHAIAVAHLTTPEDKRNDAVSDIAERYRDTDGLTVRLGGQPAVNQNITEQVGSDIAIAESIAVPITLALLILAFGGLIAGLLPLAVAAITVFGTFAVLAVLASVTDVSIFSINLTMGLGLGLAIDYALLTVSRFREELDGGADTEAAVIRTVATAGRTITFSAATVAVALSALLLFPLYFLRSFAYAGIAVIVIAMISAVVVLPALLSVLGDRVNAGRVPWARRARTAESPLWGRLAKVVMRRPVLTSLPILVMLIAAALPLLQVNFGQPDDRVLPTSVSSRQVGDTVRERFPGADTRATQVVLTGSADQNAIADYAGRLSTVDGVAGVRPQGQLLTVTTGADPRSDEAKRMVDGVRATAAPPGTTAKVTGETAVLMDSQQAIGDRLWIAALLIVVTTLVLLFLFTGSVLQPLRALVLNVIGLSATLGIMVLIFQQGWLQGLLGFTALPLDTSMLVLLFVIAFGLSMDYEVFVISRIKEARDAGASTVDAVTGGLSHTGRIVTTAAALLAVSFFAFGTSGVSFIQMFGIGSGLAILIDATLLRGILVPAAIRLLGDAAWWSPRPLRRLHGRFGISETAPPTPEREKVVV
ncbi:RND superfamily putative drug exporter [Herbihabitans rhizosphaerae]|uniref:RND superfamily putative drug exporter n=1 Tax=Herbihabitans rhizosphaerae TaxID=1872711 RepID=A0A4Q7KWB8_9PSEU|nr:MMPL family transporter [Herbihabitans rhizosphaerae]RZS40975.1 RND superfamily putative drug exporter [Herbihabitans rhizosphaerae]